MATLTRGGVRFEADGKTYTLFYSTNALCLLEADLGKGVSEIVSLLTAVDSMRLGTLRSVFWAGLLESHPNMSKTEAGVLIDQLGLPRVLEVMMAAVTGAFPAPTVADGPLARQTPNGIGMLS